MKINTKEYFNLFFWGIDRTIIWRLETVFVCLPCSCIKHLICNKILEILVKSLIRSWYWINFRLLEIYVDIANNIFSPAPVVNISWSCWWNGIFCDLPSQRFIITLVNIIFKIIYILTSRISWRFILITSLYNAFTVIRADMALRFSFQITVSFIINSLKSLSLFKI